MSFLEALYGSQYYEIHKQGKDGNKGRLNANLFLSALLVLAIIAAIFFCVRFVPGFNDSFTKSIRNVFGASSGKAIGKLLALPVFFILYFILAFTVGNKSNFQKHSENFMQLPDEQKKKANARLLIPFFILLAVVMYFAFSSLG
jgi:cbb3-type cytochrome oxidase subunit 3